MTRDLFPTVTGGPYTGCAASNFGELFYILAPDPPDVNGNEFDKGFVDTTAIATIGHEYQHLINYSRRMYVITPQLPPSQWNDEIWLHEGLSHTAESLIFHRASGLPTRANLNLDALVATDQTVNAFNQFMFGDFLLYDSYASAAATTSPFHQADDLATRGATWSFLRYAADRLGPTDGTGTGNFFYKLVNSGLLGLNNLETQIGVSPAGMQAMLRDFAISVYADDWVGGVDVRYTQPSWNMRSIYPGLCDPSDPSSLCDYPLPVKALADNTTLTKALIAGGFAVFRFTPASGVDALVRARGSGGTTLPPSINLSVIRTK